MSVRKRRWRSGGEMKESWVVDYVDQTGTRHLKTFARKREAEAWQVKVAHDINTGVHTPDSKSVTIAEAGKHWFASCEANGLEKSTLETSYKILLDKHIVPLFGDKKLSTLTIPMARDFKDKLRIDRSQAMVRKVMWALGAIVSEAQERGYVVQNVFQNLRSRRKRGQDQRAEKRQKGKLKVGIDIPAPDEIKQIIAYLDGRWRPLLLTAIFTGLRASELRGLRWQDVDLKRAELHVHQRADRYKKIGPPKSAAGERTIPLPPLLVNTLREWRLACPKSELDLVFPSGRGNVQYHDDVVERGWWPAQIAAGVTAADGKPKYTGLHSLRHFYASWCINRRVDGGLELPLKTVQSRLGHTTIQMTADTYSHLFPSGDDGMEMAKAELALRSVS